MGRRRVPPKHVASDMRTDAPETLPESPAGTRGRSSSGEASHQRREAQSRIVNTSEANTTSRQASSQHTKKQTKGLQRANERERVQPSADRLRPQPFDIQGNGISGSENVKSNSTNNVQCNGSILDAKKRRRHQSSVTSVDSSNSRKAHPTVRVEPECSDESSTDEDGGEIDLRAKTGKELCNQGEISEDDESDSSEGDECTVEASFGLFDPCEEDKAAISCLLRQSLLQSDLNFSPSVLQQLAATIAEQGNVGSTLKTVDEEDSEEDGSRQASQDHRSSKFSSPGREIRVGNNRSAALSAATPVVASGEPKSPSTKEDACGLEGRQGEGESGTMVGFLTLLSFPQYPTIAAPFKNAILKLAEEHATAECKAALERIFSGDAEKNEKRSVGSKSSCSSEVSAKPDTQMRAAEGRALNCGWLLKERLSNTPSQLIPKMYESLLDDISWSLSTEEMDEAERPFYAYSHVCGLTKVYKEADGCPSRAFKRRNMCKTLQDELLLGRATQSFAWPTGRSVRVSLEKGQSEVIPRGGSEKKSPATRVCGCPEYLLFFALPFDQFRRCKNDIAARAIEDASRMAA